MPKGAWRAVPQRMVVRGVYRGYLIAVDPLDRANMIYAEDRRTVLKWKTEPRSVPLDLACLRWIVDFARKEGRWPNIKEAIAGGWIQRFGRADKMELQRILVKCPPVD